MMVVRSQGASPVSVTSGLAVPSSLNETSFLLLQVRNPDDPMRDHEVECFERCFAVDRSRIRVQDLLTGAPTPAELATVDVVLLGGSGDYSVARGGPWLPAALDAMAHLYEIGKPTFASCWGFQAMARALGGTVITDRARAEVGVTEMHLTGAGLRDPVFAPLGADFLALSGHEDHVIDLPKGAVLLASSVGCTNQAFTFADRPIYCTQFHPELDRDGLLRRMACYPSYIPLTGASSLEELRDQTPETPHTEGILTRFLRHALGRDE